MRDPQRLERVVGRVGDGPEAGRLGLQRAHGLAERLREAAAEGHHLADRLHRRGEFLVGAGELLEREARDLHDHVVEGRFEGGRRLAGDVVGDLVEGVPDGQLRRDLGDREAGGLAGQGAGTGHPRVHLDDDQAAGVRLDRELDVAAAGVDADLAQDGDAEVAHPLVLAVGQGHGRCDGDRVAGVHAHRVDVLDRAHDDHVVVAVAHEFELVLLPAEHALLDEHLVHGRGGQAAAGEPVEVLGGARHAGAEPAHRERRPDDDRQAELGHRGADFVHGVTHPAARGLPAGLGHDVLEQLPVLAAADRLDVRADQLDVVLVEHAGLVQRDGGVERGLPAQGRQQRVGAFPGDDLLDELRRDRLDVRGVGELRVGHDRGRVGVDQADPQPLGAQHPARLGAGVVELAGLPDHDRPGADDQDVPEIAPLRHRLLISSTNRSKR